MITLTTLGGLEVVGAAAEGNLASSRRLLALLALLAVHAPRGLSRDKIASLLWPESDSPRARNSLSQALSQLRRALGVDAIVPTATDLRLNIDVVQCDLIEYDRLLAAGELEAAALRYGGPFLDGVFLRNTVEFERWVEDERARRHGVQVDLLARLAEQAQARGGPSEALKWWRLRARLAPLDSGGALRLMEALAASGDAAGALAHFRWHETMLRDEADIAPDADVVQFAESIRAPSRSPARPLLAVRPPDVEPSEDRLAASDAAGTLAPTLSAMATVASTASAEGAPRRSTKRRLLQTVGAMSVAATAIIAWSARGLDRGAAARDPALDARPTRVLVAGFIPASPADSVLATILTAGLSKALEQSRTVGLIPAPETARARQEMRWPGDPLRSDSAAREVAERTGASAFIRGRLVHENSAFVLSLELRRTSDNAVLASIPGTAPDAERLIATVDELTAELRRRMGESLGDVERRLPLAKATTSSLDALRRYSDALRAVDAGQLTAAITLLREAVTIDSTFALAWRKLAIVEANAGYREAVRDSAIAQAVRYADRLPPRERGLVLASWYMSNDLSRVIPLLESAYAEDSADLAAISQLLLEHAAQRHRSEVERYIARLETLFGTRHAAFGAISLIQVGALDAARSLLLAPPPRTRNQPCNFVRAQALVMLAHAQGAVDTVRAIGERLRRRPDFPCQVTGLLALQGDAEMRGNLTRARELYFERIRMYRIDPAMAVRDSLWQAMLDIWYGGNLSKGVARLDALADESTLGALMPHRRPDLQIAELYARAGEVAKARRVLARYEAFAPERIAGIESGARRRVQGHLAMAEGRYDDAIADFRASDVDGMGVPVRCAECSLLDLASAFEAAGRPDSAIAVYQRYLTVPPRPDAGGYNGFDSGPWYFYRSQVHRRLGALYERTGHQRAALLSYERFLALWKDADAEFQPQMRDVMRRIDLLRQGNAVTH